MVCCTVRVAQVLDFTCICRVNPTSYFRQNGPDICVCRFNRHVGWLLSGQACRVTRRAHHLRLHCLCHGLRWDVPYRVLRYAADEPTAHLGVHVVAMSNACWTLRGLWLRNRVRCSHDAGTKERFAPRRHLSTGRWAALRAEPDCSHKGVQLPQISEPRSHSLYGTSLRHPMRLFHLAGLA